MRIVDRILDILDSMESVQTVLHESPSYTNIKIDRRPAPYAILYLLTDMEIDLSRGYAVDGCDVEVFFADLVKLDADGPTHQAVVDRMAAVARQFVSLLLADKSLRFGDKVELKTAYGRFDKNVTGVSLLLHAEDRQGSCVDSEEPEVRTVEITANGRYDVTHYSTAVVSVPSHGIVLQDKTAEENGLVTADTGYDGLQSVLVSVPQPQGSTSTVIRENTTTVVDVTDYESISILTDVPAPALSLQTKTAVTNGYVTYDTGYDGLQGVNVAVPQPSGSTSVTISENTTTNVDVTDYESISVVTAVPSVQKWVGTTAQYQALAPNYDENTLYLTTD